MNCQDCELLLANGETSSVLGEALQEALQEHLRDCADCRALQQDLDANASALEDLRNEDLPRIAIKTPQRRFAYGWVAAFAAAAFVAGLLVPSRTSQPARVVAQAPSGPVATPEPILPQTTEIRPTTTRRQQFEPLKIKMLTPDPDVVIYWLLDN